MFDQFSTLCIKHLNELTFLEMVANVSQMMRNKIANEGRIVQSYFYKH